MRSSPVAARTLAVVLPLIASLVAVAPAHALQQQPPRPDTVRRDSLSQPLAPVTVTTSRAAGVTGGASAVVVRLSELRSSPAPTLDQALRETPFVLVRQNSRGEMELSVRGSDSRQAAVLYNGVPLTLGWDHRADPSVLPLTGAENLVIVRGLGSVLNGPNSLGGTIEISQRAQGTSAPSGQWWAAGGVDQTSAVVASLGGGHRFDNVFGGAVTAQAGVSVRDRDGVRVTSSANDDTARDGLRTNSDLRHGDLFGALRWSNAQGRGVGLTVSAFDAERGVPPEEHITGPRYWRYPYNSRAIAALSLNSGTFNTPFGVGTIDIGAGYNAGRLKIETYGDRRYQTVTAEELGDERTSSVRALVGHSLPRGATIKASFTAADVRYTETLSPAAGVDYRQKMSSTAAELDIPLGDATRVSGGVAFDRTSTPETGGRTPGQPPFDATGWRAGVSHQLSNSVRLHASASERSRFPALRELYSGAQNRFLANPLLKPETLLGFEAGVTAERALGESTRFSMQAIGFRHNLDDAITRITLPAPDRRFQRINRDRIESSGAELLGGLTFGSDLLRAVTLTGDATLQSISIVNTTVAGDPQRHAENNPERRGSIELGVPVPLSVRAYATARFTGVQYCLNPDSGTEQTLGKQARTDVAAERSFGIGGRGAARTLRALLSLDNVANSTVYDQCGLPQPGRTLRLMFTLR
ncbi:MAG: TonB-dependent receptor [Gemmatimonadota bacterium]